MISIAISSFCIYEHQKFMVLSMNISKSFGKKHIFQRVKELSVVTMMINESDIYICRNKFHTFANIITLLSLKNPISETSSFSRKSRTSVLLEILNVYFGFSMRKMTTSLNIHKIWCLYLWTILPYCWWLFTQSYIHISLIFVTFPRTTETPYIDLKQHKIRRKVSFYFDMFDECN